jgi:starch phosphorylase
VFKDFNALYPDKILSITNGITPRKWIYGANPELAQFITQRIGEGWITDLSQIKKLEEYADDSTSLLKLLEVKKNGKKRLIDYLQKHMVVHDMMGHGQPFRHSLSPDMIFDVQIKRMHEYKRQFLNLVHVISMYQEMVENPQARLPRLVLFAGKAAASYEKAKNIIHLIASVANVINTDTRLQGRLKLVFAENYNVSLAEKIIPAADLSQQISTAGMEASGTGNMKLSLNGALTIGTDDGANVEMRECIQEAWPFGFGASADEIHRLRTYGYNPQQIYESQPRLRKALDTLRDGTFAQNEHEARIFESLFNSILGLEGGQGDYYFVLHDFEAYEKAQRKVDQIYADPLLWARLSLLNIARMGNFSIDRCVAEYASLVWDVKPQHVDPRIFEALFVQFNEYVSCPI